MLSLHRKKLIELLSSSKNAIVFIQGGDLMYKYHTDTELPFFQESNFLYLSGVNEPGFSLALDITTGEYTLFSPKRDTEFAVWHGYITSQESYQQQYQSDVIAYDSDIENYFKKKNPSLVYCLNSEQAKPIAKLGFQTDAELLTPALADCRVIKSEWEIEQMRIANNITSEAHTFALSAIRPGMKEFDVKGLFESVAFPHNVFEAAYNGIYASGKNAAIMHYSGREAELKEGDFLLIDAGFSYKGYSGDITRTMPVSKTFTEIQAGLYQACLDAHVACIEATKPGVKMEDLHMLAAQIIMKGIISLGLVKGDLDELMEANVFALFFPHGLGHFLGLDTHDVGGYKKGVERINRPGIQYLRARRTLEPGMVITIEPGVYLVPALLQSAFSDVKYKKYLVREKLEPIMNIGGVRIEDNIVVREHGYENLSSVPKTIEDIEKARR